MVANKYWFLVIFFLFNNCFSGEQVSKENKIVEYTRLKVISAVAELGRVVEKCTDEEKGALLPKINKNILIRSKIDRKLIVQGLIYLRNRNFQICEGNARKNLAYHLGTLRKISNYYGMDYQDIDLIKNTLIYPEHTDIQAEITFYNLPENIRKHLLIAIGNSPFELLKTISENNIFTTTINK